MLPLHGSELKNFPKVHIAGQAIGREEKFVEFLENPTQQRVNEAAEKVHLLITGATGKHSLVSVNELQSLVGLLMFMVMVRQDLRGLLNSVWRCLKRETRTAKTPLRGTTHNLSMDCEATWKLKLCVIFVALDV